MSFTLPPAFLFGSYSRFRVHQKRLSVRPEPSTTFGDAALESGTSSG